MEESRLRTYSPLTLAFLGDAVFSLFMREYVVKKGNTNVNKLHKRTVGLVSANAQEKAVMALIEGNELTDDELEIFRRGENAQTETHAKNASARSYHRATGFECLIGWLYLKEDHIRIEELLKRAIEINENEQI
ncbi:MAG: ribonuclease III [Lachnospiraceae bacterium]|nr:ribonuclease III [Lachnospiraceae bacterium]